MSFNRGGATTYQQAPLESPPPRPCKVSVIAGGKTASNEEVMIPVPEEGLTATTLHSSIIQVTRTVIFKEIPQLIPLGELSSAHQLVKRLFSSLKIPTVPLAGTLVHFLGSWEKLTKDQNILQIVKGYRIPCLCRPKQKRNQRK